MQSKSSGKKRIADAIKESFFYYKYPQTPKKRKTNENLELGAFFWVDSLSFPL